MVTGTRPSLFYGELFLYFPAVLRLLGMSVQGAYRTYVMAVQAATAGISFFSFRQMFRHNKTALLGSILYMLAPYHLYNLYWRSAVGEYTALAFLPLIPAALSLLYGHKLPSAREKRVAGAQLVIAFGALLQTPHDFAGTGHAGHRHLLSVPFPPHLHPADPDRVGGRSGG